VPVESHSSLHLRLSASLRKTFAGSGMHILGIESSCDDTAAAVLADGKVLASVVASQDAIHQEFGGVVPELASRSHMRSIIPVIERALGTAAVTLDDIDAVEINEAFASVVLAWEKEHHPNMEIVNPNGGAIALGHPLGASGGKLMATLLNELERTNGRYGLLTMCEGGGLANATIIERLG